MDPVGIRPNRCRRGFPLRSPRPRGYERKRDIRAMRAVPSNGLANRWSPPKQTRRKSAGVRIAMG